MTNEQLPPDLPEKPSQMPADEATPSASPRRLWPKLVIVVVLLAAVAVVFSVKSRRPAETLAPAAQQQALSTSAPASSPETVLAAVNGEEITLGRLDGKLLALPEEYRREFARSKHLFLEELIKRALLLQEAKREDVARGGASPADPAGGSPTLEEKEDALITSFLRARVIDKVSVTEEDLRRFYDDHRQEIPGGRSFDEMREMLRAPARREKEYRAVEDYVTALARSAAITRNEEWVRQEEAKARENPLDRALGSGLPVLADFGRGTCIPCKMMKPILDGLAQEFQGRVHVLILDTGEYADIARRFRVQLIPTQIFFDADGRELYRHEGFMSREDILKKMKELGLPS
ncbi:MAG: thioredoxin domain-containing protein [Planctomycetota bacterium]